MRAIDLSKLTTDRMRMTALSILMTLEDHDTIPKALRPLGIGDATVAEGKRLYDAYVEANTLFVGFNADKIARTEALHALWEELRGNVFRRHADVARLLFDETVLVRLGLSRKAAELRRFDTFVLTAKAFYTNLLADDVLTDAMARLGVSRDELADALDRVNALYDLRTERDTLHADRKSARRTRDAHRRDLEAWISALRDRARIALRDTPKLLQLLGFIVPSE